MDGLMMDFELTLDAVLRRAEQHFYTKEIVTRMPDKSFHRYTYGDMVKRTKQLALALPLLLAFSVGLSSVLILVGSAVVALHRAGRRVSGESGWLRLLPTVSAVLLMVMGLGMARDAWKGFGAEQPPQESTSRGQ